MALQGCPHEGKDHRLFGSVTCFLQRLLSWSTTYEPISLTVAFPFQFLAYLPFMYIYELPHWTVIFFMYAAFNFPVPFSALTKWGVRKVIHVRLGWRFDFNAKRFIFPSAAIKDVDRAVFY